MNRESTDTSESRTALRKQLLELIGKRPLEPFRVHLNDGRVFDVRYPNMVLVLNTFVAIGIPEENVPDPYVERSEYVNLTDIREIELLREKVGNDSELRGLRAR